MIIFQLRQLSKAYPRRHIRGVILHLSRLVGGILREAFLRKELVELSGVGGNSSLEVKHDSGKVFRIARRCVYDLHGPRNEVLLAELAVLRLTRHAVAVRDKPLDVGLCDDGLHRRCCGGDYHPQAVDGAEQQGLQLSGREFALLVPVKELEEQFEAGAKVLDFLARRQNLLA